MTGDTRPREAKFVCTSCIGDEFLKAEIADELEHDVCSYCASQERGIGLARLADIFREALDEHFNLVGERQEWDETGQSIVEAFIDLGQLAFEDIADDAQRHLSDLYSHDLLKDGADDLYGPDVRYERKPPDIYHFKDTWESFCANIQARSRFFSAHAETDLRNIFGVLSELRSLNDKPVIREIGTADDNRFLYRVRIAFTRAELKDIITYPAREIGTPPWRRAKAGRMNPAGISVFYGAFDVETCVAEVRPPVGSYAVVGKFELIRPVNVLDLTALTELYAGGSLFDPKHEEERGRAAFLEILVREMARPVLPGDEEREYLPTQVVAEFLAAKAGLDGVIYRSAQAIGDRMNVVLFNKASVVQPDEGDPDAEFDIHVPNPSDDHDRAIYVSQRWKAKKPQSVTHAFWGVEFTAPLEGIWDYEDDGRERFAWLPSQEPTLRLHWDGVSVLRITGADYDWKEHRVARLLSRDEGSPTAVVK